MTLQCSLPTTNAGIAWPLMQTDDGGEGEWETVMVACFTRLWEVSPRLEWSSPLITNCFQAWMSQWHVSTDIRTRGCWEACAPKACLSDTVGWFCFSQSAHGCHAKVRRARWHWWGKPSVEENGGLEMWKNESFVMLETHSIFFFFWGFFLFRSWHYVVRVCD